MMICTKLVSFPTRERGLKQRKHLRKRQKIPVVPYAGTWIETVDIKTSIHKSGVVPYAGTWIETQVRMDYVYQARVVPYAGTWIETCEIHGDAQQYLSFPTRERGLKLVWSPAI